MSANRVFLNKQFSNYLGENRSILDIRAGYVPTPTPSITSTPPPTPTPTPSPTPPPAGTNEANAYLSAVVAAGGTGLDATISAATRSMFISLFSNNLWNKMTAFYPLLGENANGCKFNGKNPLDTDAAYRLTFFGGWAFDAYGATPNGTNAYANTHLSGTTLDRFAAHTSYYSQTFSSTNSFDIGSKLGAGGSSTNVQLSINTAAFGGNFRNFSNHSSGPSTNTTLNTGTTGYFISSRISDTKSYMYKNGVQDASGSTVTNGHTPFTLYIGSDNNNGTPNQYSSKKCGFASIGSGLTESEMVTLTTIVNDWATILLRNTYPVPQQGMIYRFDSYDTSNFTLRSSGGTDYVEEWFDISGKGNNLRQTTEAFQPVLENDGFGNNMVVFDGSNDRLFKTGISNIPSGITAYTEFTVIRIDNFAVDFVCDATNADSDGRYTGSIKRLTPLWYPGPSFQPMDTWVKQPNFLVYAQKATSAPSMKGLINGLDQTGVVFDSWSPDPAITTIYLGSNASGTGEFFPGGIREIIAYDRILTDTEISEVVAYLENKWNYSAW